MAVLSNGDTVVGRLVVGIITTCLPALSSFEFQHGALSGPPPGFLRQRIHFLAVICWQSSAGRWHWQLMIGYWDMHRLATGSHLLAS